MSAHAPFVTGLRLRCPQCGKGRLFQSYLKFAPRCTACGADFAIADAGDGPAVFVMFLVGAIVVPLAFVLQFALKLPDWIVLSVAAAATIGLSLFLLPRFKAILFALQWRHKAGEGRLAADADKTP
ncbi:MAG: DUF983 domain-containing protein [Hyphomonadaceae bacterium]|nr:DUF983 domain-containing protein [Hyphomonadaceae bacterium]